jgi:hypothetical protein
MVTFGTNTSRSVGVARDVLLEQKVQKHRSSLDLLVDQAVVVPEGTWLAICLLKHHKVLLPYTGNSFCQGCPALVPVCQALHCVKEKCALMGMAVMCLVKPQVFYPTPHPRSACMLGCSVNVEAQTLTHASHTRDVKNIKLKTRETPEFH